MSDKTTILNSPFPSHLNNGRNGSLSYLPTPWRPYGELIRLHKPVGILNIYFPYLFGCFLAACISRRTIEPAQLATAVARMLVVAFVLRSMGCAWNDIVDRDLDRQTYRCKNRPMARGAISVRHAVIFTVGLLLLLIWISYRLMTESATLYAIPVPLLTGLYPYAKRITNFAQLVLGVTLSLGVFVGAAQLDMSLMATLSRSTDHRSAYGVLCLFVAYVVFSLVHDTIYAFQDLEDDKTTGAKSMAVLFAKSSYTLLSALTILQVGSLIGVGSFQDFGYGWYIISCLGVGLLYGAMLMKLDVGEPGSCWLWFKLISLGFGLLLSLGFFWQYALDM